jgi:hypothetical protein
MHIIVPEGATMNETPARRRSPYFRPLAILCLAGAAVFAGLSLAVAGSESVTHLDTTVSQACHRHGIDSPGTVQFFQTVTWFGTFKALTALSVVAILAIAHVGQGSALHHAQGVFEIGALGVLREGDGIAAAVTAATGKIDRRLGHWLLVYGSGAGWICN